MKNKYKVGDKVYVYLVNSDEILAGEVEAVIENIAPLNDDYRYGIKFDIDNSGQWGIQEYRVYTYADLPMLYQDIVSDRIQGLNKFIESYLKIMA